MRTYPQPVPLRELLSFPNPVNEKAARVVAGGVLLLGVLTLATGWDWLLALIALGFLARVLAGPRFSALGQLATRLVVAALVFGATLLPDVLLGVLLVFAFGESVVGFCAGCWLFGRLMRLGVIPAQTCEACNDIWSRESAQASSAS